MNAANTHIYDYLVIGKGLMGTAAARYLSQVTPSVAIVGPDEPADWKRHRGLFASHYDQGRITRRLARGEVWTALGLRAIGQYPYLEKNSGIQFYWPVGGLYVAPHGSDDVYLANVAAAGQRFSLDFTLCATPLELARAEGRFAFPANCHGLLEPLPAGYINPRDMLRAELTIARQQGARVVAEVATAVTPHRHALEVTTESGATLWARDVLVAGGAFSNCHDLLPRPLDLRVKSETILLACLSEAETERLSGLPTLIYDLEDPDLDGIYLLPPIRYPDGRFYLKMGCNTRADQWLPDLAAMRDWMIRGDSEQMAGPMRAALHAILPDLTAEAYSTGRCLVTYTPHGKPFIDQVDDHLFVATGGNGASAKCADTLGWLAAMLMQTGGWSLGFDRSLFRAIFK